MAASSSPMAAMESFHPPVGARDDWQALVGLIGNLRRETATWPSDIDQVTRWYEPHLDRIYDDAHVRLGDLAQLQQIATTYATRERFLTEITLDPPGATSDEAGVPGLDDDYLILSTIHSAKGQEWKAVQVLNVVDGCIPSDMSTGTTEGIEEERRLLYVAMTRARDHLRLMLPQRFYVHQQSGNGDHHVYASRSRFIPNALTRFFESLAWPIAPPSQGPIEANATTSTHRIDISARVRGLWR
jgi:DNA helicase-2/ATP-dependent DNA helicase PcrA